MDTDEHRCRLLKTARFHGKYRITGQRPESKEGKTEVRPSESVFICVHLWLHGVVTAKPPPKHSGRAVCPRQTTTQYKHSQ